MVFLAPVRDRHGKTLQEQLLAQLEVVPFYFGNILFLSAQEKLWKVFLQPVSEPFFKLIKQSRRIRHCIFFPFRKIRKGTAPMRLICENSQDLFSQPFSALFSIFFMGHFQEFPNRLPAHGIQITEPVVIIRTDRISRSKQDYRLPFLRIFPFEKLSLFRKDAILHAERKNSRSMFNLLQRIPFFLFIQVHFQKHGTVTGIPRHNPARTSGRPAILVIQPGLHPLFLSIVCAGIDQREPLFSQILCFQSGSGMHEESSETHFMHYVDLSCQLCFVQLPVPCPKGLSTELCGRLFKQFLSFSQLHLQSSSCIFICH